MNLISKTLTIVFSLFFSLQIFAQLTVRNDAYVYVKDQLLYVKDDVNLTEPDSKIYLREESQLIQGDGTTGNSGVGELSVYQEGTTNQWSYNYWCSPVGNNATNNSINNPFRYRLIDDPRLDTTTDLIDSSDPVFSFIYNGNPSTTPITLSTYWTYTLVSSDEYSEWTYVGGATDDINPGLGFTMKGMGTGTTGNQTYDFRGKPNNGDITNPVATGQFTLVGNPYPSAIDSAAFVHDTDNAPDITGTLFYWEQYGDIPSHVLVEIVGGYSEFTINAAGTIISNTPATFYTYDAQDNTYSLPPGPPAGGSKTARRYIPIGQGFMVEGSTGTTGDVTVKNAHRVYEKEGTNSYFFRSSTPTQQMNSDEVSNDGIQYQDNGLPIVPSDFKRFRINVDFTVGDDQYTRQVLLNFHDTATAGFDYGLELARSSNHPTDAYFSYNDKSFSGVAYPFEETLVIPLIVDIEEQQPLRFRIFDIQNFEDTQGIYIHDTATDVYVNLRELDYELNVAPGNYTNRFEIVFQSNQSLNVNDIEASTLSINQNNNLSQLLVSNPNNLDIKKVEVYDVSGKRVIQFNTKSVADRYEISTANLSEGVYVVNVISNNNNALKSQKVIVKN